MLYTKCCRKLYALNYYKCIIYNILFVLHTLSVTLHQILQKVLYFEQIIKFFTHFLCNFAINVAKHFSVLWIIHKIPRVFSLQFCSVTFEHFVQFLFHIFFALSLSLSLSLSAILHLKMSHRRTENTIIAHFSPNNQSRSIEFARARIAARIIRSFHRIDREIIANTIDARSPGVVAIHTHTHTHTPKIRAQIRGDCTIVAVLRSLRMIYRVQLDRCLIYVEGGERGMLYATRRVGENNSQVSRVT